MIYSPLHHRRWTLLCFFLIVLSPGLVIVRTQTQSKARAIPATTGPPIAARLLPDDDLVVVNRIVEGVQFDPSTTITDLVSEMTTSADLVLRAKIEGFNSVLVEQGTWISTGVRAMSSVVFKSPTWATKSRDLDVTFQVDGGEVRIGKVLVRTRPRIELQAGREYLLFLRASQAYGVLELRYEPLLIKGGRLFESAEPPDSQNLLVGATVEEVVREIRKFAK
ncbi:MAG: hypothetical protein ABL962_15770 [Fimbriimonadaceae bacterium]